MPAGRVALIASIDGVKLRRPVVPGDQLRLEVRSQRIKNSSACIKGQARVGESLAAEAQFRFVIVDADRVAGSLEGRYPHPRAGSLSSASHERGCQEGSAHSS